RPQLGRPRSWPGRPPADPPAHSSGGRTRRTPGEGMIVPRREVLATPPAVHGGPRGSLDEESPVRLDFSVSLNAWGPAPEVLQAVRSAPVDRYPDPECLAPRRAAAERWGCDMDEVAFGAGAAALLQAVCFAYLRPG